MTVWVATVLMVPALVGTAAAADTKVTAPAVDTCEWAAQKLFEGARKGDFDAMFEVMHPDTISNPNQRQSLRRYSFKQLVKRVPNICAPESKDACHYTTTRVQDVKKERKVFVKKFMKGASMPCPITCRQAPRPQQSKPQQAEPTPTPAPKSVPKPWRVIRIGCI